MAYFIIANDRPIGILSSWNWLHPWKWCHRVVTHRWRRHSLPYAVPVLLITSCIAPGLFKELMDASADEIYSHTSALKCRLLTASVEGSRTTTCATRITGSSPALPWQRAALRLDVRSEGRRNAYTARGKARSHGYSGSGGYERKCTVSEPWNWTKVVFDRRDAAVPLIGYSCWATCVD